MEQEQLEMNEMNRQIKMGWEIGRDYGILMGVSAAGLFVLVALFIVNLLK